MTVPLFALLAFLGRRTAVDQAHLQRRKIHEDAPKVGCSLHLHGSEYISGWPPKQRSTPKEALELYGLIHVITAVLDKAGVHFWADAGTLLGAKRHQGLMPQECDADFALWRDDVMHFSPGSEVLKELATYGIRVFHMSFYMAFRACIVKTAGLEGSAATNSQLGCREPYIDFHTAEVVFSNSRQWKYSHFPDDRVSKHVFSLDGLLIVQSAGRVVKDMRSRIPFGDTFVWAAQQESPASQSADYLEKVYGKDCMTTMRQRDSRNPRNRSSTMTEDRPLVKRMQPWEFVGMIARPTGPLRNIHIVGV